MNNKTTEMSLPKPYYQDDYATIYHADCRDVLPLLPHFDLLLTDPPYGIQRDKGGANSRGRDGFGTNMPRKPRAYEGDWDAECPPGMLLAECIDAATISIVWGGNYMCDKLAQNGKWLVWDKWNTMPTYSDAELAWTNLPGNSVKMYRQNGSGLMAKEKERFHPTQKPIGLMLWCIGLALNPRTILDPFMGSGTTLRAAKDLGLKATGIEVSEEFCEIAAKRMAQECLAI